MRGIVVVDRLHDGRSLLYMHLAYLSAADVESGTDTFRSSRWIRSAVQRNQSVESDVAHDQRIIRTEEEQWTRPFFVELKSKSTR